MANKTGKGGFKDNPENRNKNGQLNKEAVAFSRSMRTLLIEHGEKPAKEGNKSKRIEELIDVIWELALNGKEWAVQFVADRVEGKVTQPISGDISLNGTIQLNAVDYRNGLDTLKPE